MPLSATDIEQALRGLPDLPVQVDSWQVETGTDWTDDAAVWVWGILPDPDIDTPTHFALRKAIRGVVREHAGNDIGVYIWLPLDSRPAPHHMTLHADLLKQAGFLARRKPKRPPQASLWRAVSASKQALFYLLVYGG